MKRIWRNAKSLGLTASTASSPTPSFTADEFNKHLCGKHSIEIPTTSSLGEKRIYKAPKRTAYDISNQFAFKHVTEVEIYESLFSIRSNSIGMDYIPLRFVKLLIFVTMPHIKHIINFSITSSSCSDLWKMSKVFPVHKKGRHFDLSDFRAVHILPVMSKLFENLLAKQIQEFISRRNLMSPLQSGFRPAHSTTTAMLKIAHDINRALDKKLMTILLLLDFSAAFDSVNHKLLCGKLR